MVLIGSVTLSRSMNVNPRESSARSAMNTNRMQIRRRTPLPVMAYAVYLSLFSGHSPRRASKSLRTIMSRSHASIWRWVQGLGPVLGSFGADPREVHRAFVDETTVNVGGTSAQIWVAFEPGLRAMPDFHVARAGTPSTPIYSSGGPCIYGRVPIYTDGAGWCSGACGWAGVERVVYGHPLKNPVERVVQYVKEGTEAFDDPFPAGGRRLASWRAFERVLSWL